MSLPLLFLAGAITHVSPPGDPPAPPSESPAPPEATAPPPPPAPLATEYDPRDEPGKTHYFVGLRYRGTFIPKGFLNLFLDEGKSLYSNSIGAELDIRRGGFSVIPSLSYTEFGFDDFLFRDKGKDANIAGYWSNISSSLKGAYANVDILWSVKMSKNFEFEFGAGLGAGLLLGNIRTSWVQIDPNGSLVASSGQRFSECQAEGAPGSGCNRADHQGSDPKLKGYQEKKWSDGGSVPNMWAQLTVPEIGVRFKPVKEVSARAQVGFTIPGGLWFGLSGHFDVGTLSKPKAAPSEATAGAPDASAAPPTK